MKTVLLTAFAIAAAACCMSSTAAACEVHTAPLIFNTAGKAQGEIGVRCAPGPYFISLISANNAGGEYWKLIHGPDGAYTYETYMDSSMTRSWGVGFDNFLIFTGNGDLQRFPLYASFFEAPDELGLSSRYSDMIVVEVVDAATMSVVGFGEFDVTADFSNSETPEEPEEPEEPEQVACNGSGSKFVFRYKSRLLTC